MADLTAILKYQETDKKLFALERELASCEERKKYVQAKKFLEGAAEKLDSLEAKATALKGKAAEIIERSTAVEKELAELSGIDELIEGGADGIHLYAMNNAEVAGRVYEGIKDLLPGRG